MLAPLRVYLALLCAGFVLFGAEAHTAGAQEHEGISPYDEFKRATVSGAERKLRDWLSGGGDPNMPFDVNESAAMHYAAVFPMHSRRELLSAAIVAGGDCVLRNTHGETPLHYAAAGEDFSVGPETTRILLDCGVDPNVRDNYGNTPLLALYVSVRQGLGADASHTNVLTARMMASSVGDRDSGGANVNTLRALLDAGADPNARNASGDRPLMIAARRKDAGFSMMRHEHLQQLLGAGADPDARGPGVDSLGGQTGRVVTPLIQALLSHPGDEDERLGIVQFLLEAGAGPDRSDEAGDTPLAYAISRLERPSATIKVLLDAGADPNLRDGSGETLLMQAVLGLEAPAAAVRALLEGGANPCLRGRDGKLPSYVAESESETWRLLVNAGGFLDLDTGVCMHEAWKGEEKEKALGLSRDARRGIQSCLKTQGFDPGPADGLFGPRTRAAIRSWQSAQGEDSSEAAGYISSQDQLDALLAGCRVALEPLCTGETGTPCWQEIANQPGCHRWNPLPQPDETVTWTGDCVDGKASGKGRSVWRFRQDGRWKTSGDVGELREGKTLIGHWFERYSSGAMAEGPYVDGKRHGHWVWHNSNGEVWEGPYVEGKFHGLWVRRGSRGEHWNCWFRDEGIDVENFDVCANLTTAPYQMHATAGVSLHSGPSGDYEQIGRTSTSAKETVTVTHRGPDWAWVETESGDQGFAPLSALQEVRTETGKSDPVAAEPQVVSSEPEAAEVDVVTEPKCVFLDELTETDEYGWLNRQQQLREKVLSDGERRSASIAISKEVGLVVEKCWLELSHTPGCYVFWGTLNEDGGEGSAYYVDVARAGRWLLEWREKYYYPKNCANGLLHGQSKEFEAGWAKLPQTDTFVNGKEHSNKISRQKFAEWCDMLGKYEDGLRQGEWVLSCPTDHDNRSGYLTSHQTTGDIVFYEEGELVECRLHGTFGGDYFGFYERAKRKLESLCD